MSDRINSRWDLENMIKFNVKSVLKYGPLVLIILLLILLYRGSNNNNSIKIKNPDIVFPSLLLNSENIAMKQLIGKRYVLQFFATWCGYCMEEYDAFLKMDKKIPIYGILWADDPKNGKMLVEEKGSPFINIGVDQYGAISKQFGISVIPQTFVIDEKGRIIFHRMGFFDPNYLTKFF